MDISQSELERYLLKRKLAEKQAGITTSIKSKLFKQQVDFLEDKSTEKAALCTRRAGKTTVARAYLAITMLENPGCLVQYWAPSLRRAKELMWRPFLSLVDEYGIRLAGDPNNTEYRIFFENKSELRLIGADKEKEAQKKRGDAVKLAIVDEAQYFSSFLKTLCDDVLGASMLDYGGTTCLMGTPGVTCGGYWYEVTGGSTGGHGYSLHKWTYKENTPMPDIAVRAEKKRIQMGWALDNPTWQREFCGLWVNDWDALFYRFERERNTKHWVQPEGEGWQHVLGWDLGHRDAMAVVVFGYRPGNPRLYEAFSWKKPGAGVDEMASLFRELDSRFSVVSRVADTGGGGAMMVEEVARRHGIRFEAAKKTDKFQHVTLMNDDLISGRIQLNPDGGLASEMSQLPIESDWSPKSGKPPKEDPRFDNHLCLVAGTLISTPGGAMAIESVCAGDFVFTRLGSRKVLDSFYSGIVETWAIEIENGAILIGSADHPVWTARGFVPIAEIECGEDFVCLENTENQRESSITGKSLGDTRKAALGHCGYIFYLKKAKDFIGRFTSIISGKYLKAFTSTISTGIRSIIQSKTLPLSMGGSTSAFICANMAGQKLQEKISCLPYYLRQNGTGLRLGLCGTESMGMILGKTECFSTANAIFVAHAFSRKLKQLLSVVINVMPRKEEHQALTTLNLGATDAVACSSKINTQNRKTVQGAVVRKWKTGLVEKVYNLTVDGEHEYFANGILVSNCDAALYAWRRAYHWVPEEKPEQLSKPDYEEKKMLEQAEESFQKEQEMDWWER